MDDVWCEIRNSSRTSYDPKSCYFVDCSAKDVRDDIRAPFSLTAPTKGPAPSVPLVLRSLLKTCSKARSYSGNKLKKSLHSRYSKVLASFNHHFVDFLHERIMMSDRQEKL